MSGKQALTIGRKSEVGVTNTPKNRGIRRNLTLAAGPKFKQPNPPAVVDIGNVSSIWRESYIGQIYGIFDETSQFAWPLGVEIPKADTISMGYIQRPRGCTKSQRPG